MPSRAKRPEDEKPLFRSVNGQQLIRPVGAGQAEAAQATAEQEKSRGATQGQAASQAQATSQGQKGPIAGALDRAQENNWVYDSVANTLRQTGLVSKADALLSKLSSR